MHSNSFYEDSISLITSPDEERSQKIHIHAKTNKNLLIKLKKFLGAPSHCQSLPQFGPQ